MSFETLVVSYQIKLFGSQSCGELSETWQNVFLESNMIFPRNILTPLVFLGEREKAAHLEPLSLLCSLLCLRLHHGCRDAFPFFSTSLSFIHTNCIGRCMSPACAPYTSLNLNTHDMVIFYHFLLTWRIENLESVMRCLLAHSWIYVWSYVYQPGAFCVCSEIKRKNVCWL